MTATPPDSALLELRGIVYKYGAINALREVDLSVRKGEAVCVIGPNGAGKTTLARVAGGLYRPAKGQVLIDGEPCRAALMTSWSAASAACWKPSPVRRADGHHNLELGCYRSGLDKATVEERLEKIMTLFPVLRARAQQRTSTMSAASSRWSRSAGR